MLKCTLKVHINIFYSPSLSYSYSLFFYTRTLLSLRLCLDGWNLGRMENGRGKIGVEKLIFHCLERGENQREWKTGRDFSLPGPQNSSSQNGRKIRESGLHEKLFYQNTHPPTLIHTLTYPAEDFCPIQAQGWPMALRHLPTCCLPLSMLMPSQFFVKGVMFG